MRSSVLRKQAFLATVRVSALGGLVLRSCSGSPTRPTLIMSDGHWRLLPALLLARSQTGPVREDDRYDAMRASLGEVYQGATGYLVGSTEMRLLFNPDSPTEAVHKYAHLASIQGISDLISNYQPVG